MQTSNLKMCSWKQSLGSFYLCISLHPLLFTLCLQWRFPAVTDSGQKPFSLSSTGGSILQLVSCSKAKSHIRNEFKGNCIHFQRDSGLLRFVLFFFFFLSMRKTRVGINPRTNAGSTLSPRWVESTLRVLSRHCLEWGYCGWMYSYPL